MIHAGKDPARDIRPTPALVSFTLGCNSIRHACEQPVECRTSDSKTSAGRTYSFGGRFERIVKKSPGLKEGLLGISVSADVYSYDVGVGSFRFIPIGATANYHFELDPKNKLDLFVGAGLGFSLLSCSGLINVQPLRVASASEVSASVTGTAAAGRCGAQDSERYFIGPGVGRRVQDSEQGDRNMVSAYHPFCNSASRPALAGPRTPPKAQPVHDLLAG